MASRARARTPVATKAIPSLRVTIGDTEVRVDPLSATILERWEAKEALRAELLPTDDDELMMGAVIWTMAKRHLPDLTLREVLSGVTLGALMEGSEGDADSPEA
jgi:hypothetical protein